MFNSVSLTLYFNSRPHGGRRGQSTDYSNSIHFNSRPHGGRQLSEATRSLETVISTHALTEGDLIRKRKLMEAQKFQLTPSRRATSQWRYSWEKSQKFQLTPSRRATISSMIFCRSASISTHALTEGDESQGRPGTDQGISTHALTEGDLSGYVGERRDNISTHALTEGDRAEAQRRTEEAISTHALTEGDRSRSIITRLATPFQLTPSRRATGSTESSLLPIWYFNSRPHGGRQQI